MVATVAHLTVKLDVFNSQNQTQFVKVRVHVSVSSRLRDLVVEMLNKFILRILVYNLFYRHTTQ